MKYYIYNVYNRNERKIGIGILYLFFFLETEAIKISISIEIQQKPPTQEEKNRQVLTSKDIYELEEIKAIKNAIQEHMFFIGLDTKNNIRNINLIGIGTSREINIDLKEIVRLALMNACDKVVLAHNHPSNVLKPSKSDIEMTNIVGVFLRTFNIQLVDHLILGNEEYLSMNYAKYIDLEYKEQKIYAMQNSLLKQENEELKQENQELKLRLNEQEQEKEIDEEMEL